MAKEAATAGAMAIELQSARKRSGLSREKVASGLNVSAKTIERWEKTGHIGPAELRAIRAFYRDALASEGGSSLDNDVPRDTSNRAVVRGTLGPLQGGDPRLMRITVFEREMIRMGASDLEADDVRERAASYLESLLARDESDVDRQLDLYLEASLRPWVTKRIEHRASHPDDAAANPMVNPGRGAPVLPEEVAGEKSAKRRRVGGDR